MYIESYLMHHQRIRVLLKLFSEMYSIRSIEASPVTGNMSLVLFSLHRRGSFSLCNGLCNVSDYLCLCLTHETRINCTSLSPPSVSFFIPFLLCSVLLFSTYLRRVCPDYLKYERFKRFVIKHFRRRTVNSSYSS